MPHNASSNDPSGQTDNPSPRPRRVRAYFSRCPGCGGRNIDELGSVHTLQTHGHWCRDCGSFRGTSGEWSIPHKAPQGLEGGQ